MAKTQTKTSTLQSKRPPRARIYVDLQHEDVQRVDQVALKTGLVTRTAAFRLLLSHGLRAVEATDRGLS